MKLITNNTAHSAQNLICGSHHAVLSERNFGGVITCRVDFADIGNTDMFASATIRYGDVSISAVMTGIPTLRYYDSMRLAGMDGMKLSDMNEI